VSALAALPPDEGNSDPRGPARADTPRRRSYDAAFKAEAVARIRADKARISDVAAELGISASTLRRWLKADADDASPDAAASAPLDAVASDPPDAVASDPPDAAASDPPASPATPAPDPPGDDGASAADAGAGSLVEGLEPTVNDSDRPQPDFGEPSMEGSSHGSADPLASDTTRDVLSADHASDAHRHRPRPRPTPTAQPVSGTSTGKARTPAEETEDPWSTGSDPSGQSAAERQKFNPEDPNVLAMLDAILEMFPKPGAAPSSGELTQPGPAAHRAVESERDRIPLHPGDDIFPGLSALVPAYRFPIIMALLLGAVGVSRFIPTEYALRPVALALHVISLVIAFGAVLVIDWHGLLWLFGRRGLGESVRLAAAAGPLIWGGLFGLIASGALLHPDISQPLTLVKLSLVLLVAWNGAAMATLRRRMAQLPNYVKPGDLPWRDWSMLMGATVVSQVGWWGAIVIGFVNSST